MTPFMLHIKAFLVLFNLYREVLNSVSALHTGVPVIMLQPDMNAVHSSASVRDSQLACVSRYS